MKLHWKERFHAGGICDFKKNYDFYFKWLLNKTASCIYIKGLPDSLDEMYIKTNLLIDGDIGITKFNDKLYAVIGNPGGQPDEYYAPTIYTVANPVLGSKQIDISKDGIVIYNTDLDKWIPGGLYGLIDQTATLLADNVISINCSQINTRVSAIFTADSEAQAVAGEIALKKIYAGAPYQVLRSDIIDKIQVNPIATSATGQNLTELVELNNYIIANYFQSIGIRSNNIRKRSHVLQDEIDVQNDYLQVSILEVLTSWQSGFDKVNEMYGTDIHVELNPALLDTLIDDSDNTPDDNQSASTEEVIDNTPNEPNASENKPGASESILETQPEPTVTEPETVVDGIKGKEQQVQELIDMINDATGDESDDNNTEEVDDDETTE